MSTSDSQGKAPLTRKQLRQMRLAGAIPEVAAPAEAPAAPRPTEEKLPAEQKRPVSPASDAPVGLGAAPLTRRQAREQERMRTAAVPVVEQDPSDDGASSDRASQAPSAPAEGIVSGVPAFTAPAEPAGEVIEPVAEPAGSDAEPVVEPAAPAARDAATQDAEVPAARDAAERDAAVESAGTDDSAADLAALGVDEDAIEDVDDAGESAERPRVNPLFGSKVLEEAAAQPTPSFDELVGDASGTQTAPSALIFNPAPGQGSLSGPIASTGEVLITGSYELPEGIGSRGHARGTTDGKEVDVELIDGELPPASSPTPIAASSAISTSKPAGEVIRPPAPEKGNKLMLALAITAGGLALVLAAALVVAFTTNIL